MGMGDIKVIVILILCCTCHIGHIFRSKSVWGYASGHHIVPPVLVLNGSEKLKNSEQVCVQEICCLVIAHQAKVLWTMSNRQMDQGLNRLPYSWTHPLNESGHTIDNSNKIHVSTQFPVH